MHDTVAPAAVPAPLNPPKVDLGESLPFAILALFLLALVYMVGMDEGAAALIPGNAVHEFVHDGRHLLGFPCH